MVDTLISVVLIILGVALVAVIIGAAYDAGHNGINDCGDSPEYCVTPQELQREWPEFMEVIRNG